MTRVRPATPTVAFIDHSGADQRGLFHTVRPFEQFTALHLGLLAQTRRTALPRLGQAVHADPQARPHFLAHADWSVEALRRQRLEGLRRAVGDRPFVLCLDETGARTKGQTTDAGATQSSGNLHPLANGIGSVTASGLRGPTTFPRRFRLVKPESRLKPGDGYKTQPQLAIAISEDLVALGFRFGVVLADSLQGARGPFISALPRWGLHDVVAIRSNHGVWLRPGQRLRQTRWRPFERVFPDGGSEPRFIRETISGPRQLGRSYQLTTDPATRPPETTGDLMPNLPGKSAPTVGNTVGRRPWIEQGFQQAKDDLGWADDRVTDAASIERWGELVLSADTLVSLQSLADAAHDQPSPTPQPAPALAPSPPTASLEPHPAWDAGTGWKHQLNNLRLLLPPDVCSCLLFPWLALAPPPHPHAVQTGLAALGALVNTFRLALPT